MKYSIILLIGVLAVAGCAGDGVIREPPAVQKAPQYNDIVVTVDAPEHSKGHVDCSIKYEMYGDKVLPLPAPNNGSFGATLQPAYLSHEEKGMREVGINRYHITAPDYSYVGDGNPGNSLAVMRWAIENNHSDFGCLMYEHLSVDVNFYDEGHTTTKHLSSTSKSFYVCQAEGGFVECHDYGGAPHIGRLIQEKLETSYE